MTTNPAAHLAGIIIGWVLSLIFIAYIFLSSFEGRPSRISRVPQRIAGVISFILGIGAACTWTFFLFTGWSSFLKANLVISFHVLSEGVAATALVVAGYAMLMGWSRASALFVIADALLILTTAFALTNYAPNTNHPFSIIVGSVILTTLFTFIVALTYGWEHFVFHMDEKRQPDQKKAA